MRGDNRGRRAKQRGEDVTAIEATLVCGPQDVDEDLLRISAAR